MTFLNPAILFALAAASIPVVLHFLNLRKLKKVEFSTLIFLKELQKTKIRKIKFKQLLLLFLRILIIVLLVFAFARPTVQTGFLGSTKAKTSAVIIIDNTFSMSIVGNDGSYFNKSKQIAKSILTNFDDGDEVSVIFVADKPEPETQLSLNFDYIKRQIDESKISYTSRTINEAIIRAGQILYTSKNFNKEIYLLTDLQEGRIFNSENELSNLEDLFKSVKFFVVELHSKDAINLGIDAFTLDNQILQKNKTINFTASVSNYSSISVDNTVASLFINGKRSAQQSVTLQPGETKKMLFETTLQDTGLIIAAVELEDDDINFDNKRFLSFYVPDQVKILLLTANKSDSKFIKLALAPTSENSFNITEQDNRQASIQNYDKYDCVIIIGAENLTDVKKLIEYVEAGGGIVLMPGSNTEITSLNTFLKSAGISTTANFVGKQNSTESVSAFENVNLDHPIFNDLYDAISKTKIESPDIYFYSKLSPGLTGNTLISMYDKSAFLSEYKLGNGILLVFNTPPVLSSTNFPLKSFFAPLINKSVFYVSSKTENSQKIISGDQILINLQKFSSKQIKVLKPDNSEEYISTDSITGKKFFNYEKTNQTGTYNFFNVNELIDYKSINHNPKESVVKYHDVDDFENYLEKIGFDGNIVTLDKEEDISKPIYQSRYGTELWKYFLIASLFLALLEMFISKSSKKDLAEFENK